MKNTSTNVGVDGSLNRSRRPWGSVKPTPSGRFTAKYTGADKKRYRIHGTFPDEKTAWYELSKVRTAIDLGIWGPPKKREPTPKRKKPVEARRTIDGVPTVAELVRRWLKDCEI